MAKLALGRASIRPRQKSSGLVLFRRFVVELFFYTLMLFLAGVFLLPLVWMIGASLKEEAQILTIPPTLFPRVPQWHNYADMWRANIFSTLLFNSTKLAILNVGGILLVSSLAGYGFARLQFAGRDLAFSLLLSTIMVPGIVTLIPQFIIFRNIGWIDTHYPLWVPRVMTPVFGTFLLRQFFKTLPQDLEDAGKIDGASTFGIYWRIMLPQVRPALAAVGVFTFLDSWNDLFGPLIFVNRAELQTLPVGLALFQGEFATQINLLMAAATLTVVPVLVVYFAAQRYFIQGIALTGLK